MLAGSKIDESPLKSKESPLLRKESTASRKESPARSVETEIQKPILDLIRCELKIFKLTIHAIEKSTN